MSNSPNANIPFVPEGTLDPAAGLNDSIRVIDALIQAAVINMTTTAPPGTNADGDRYIVNATATGDWAGHEDQMAQYIADGDFWEFYTPGVNVVLVLNKDDGILYRWDDVNESPGQWVPAGGSGITVEGEDSPSEIVLGALTLLFGAGFVVTEETGGVARIEGGGGDAAAGHGTKTALTISSNTITLDHSLGADFDLSLTADVNTVNHTNLTTGDVNWFSMRIVQDGTGGRTFTPPASWRYPSGVAAYSPSAGANDIDLVQGVSYSDGTNWLISYEKDYT